MYVGDRLHQWAWDRFYKRRKVIRHVGGRTGKIYTINKKTGARGLRSILENILLKTMFELPGQENIDEVVIDLGAAKGQNDPLIIHSKDAKNKSEKTSAA